MAGASIEATLELWASSLRDAKSRVRSLFTQERVAASLRLLIPIAIGIDCRLSSIDALPLTPVREPQRLGMLVNLRRRAAADREV